jgi:DNA-binding Xre family transcriptional regulator
MAKLGNGGNVNTKALLAICNALSCDVGDIMEFIPDKEQGATDNGKKPSASF